MRYYTIDAFSTEIFGGNPAGVVIYENLDEKSMQKIAAEVRFSETAFIKQLNDETFKIRFFTPNSEVDLCGHATMASFTALVDDNLITKDGTYYMETLAGKLPVNVSNDFVMMQQATPQCDKPIEEYSELAKIMGISQDEIGDENYPLKPQRVSTGLFDIMMPVRNKEILNKITPNMSKLSSFSKENNVTGVHAYTLDKTYTARCRNFAPLYEIDEEAATGTSNGALTYHLYLNNIIKPNTLNTFIQGEKMERPSIITSKLICDNTIKIMVGGKSKVLIKGEIFI